MKKVTVQDVAAKAGVSPSTVSRVLNQNGYVAEDKKQLVMNAVSLLGYQLSAPAAETRAKGNRIAVIAGYSSTSELVLSPYSLFTTSVVNSASRRGYRSVSTFLASRVENTSLLSLLPSVREDEPTGLIIQGYMEEGPTPELDEALKALPFPVVFIENARGCEAYNRVLVDNTQGIMAAARYLIRRGHRSILYVTHDARNISSADDERLQGVMKIVGEAKDSGVVCHVLHMDMETDGIAKAGFNAMEQGLMKYPEATAVINWADGFAAGELAYLSSVGKKCPDDIEIIGHDDVLAPYLAPPISSVRFPYGQVADAALDIIESLHQDPDDYYARTTTIVPRFIQR